MDGYTPLIEAAYSGSTESVKLLLENGADVAATNDVSIIINYTPIVIVKSNISF